MSSFVAIVSSGAQLCACKCKKYSNICPRRVRLVYDAAAATATAAFESAHTVRLG